MKDAEPLPHTAALSAVADSRVISACLRRYDAPGAHVATLPLSRFGWADGES